jgi:mRNA-degrading endonuclease RelE of RelBE toxin-antitoxin system
VSGGRTIVFAPEAAKEFDVLDTTVRDRIEKALDQLAMDPLALKKSNQTAEGRLGDALARRRLAHHI